MENILNTIDAISLEVASILQKSEENGGGVVENGGRSATLTPAFVTDQEHHNLQVQWSLHMHTYLYILYTPTAFLCAF